MSDYMTNDEIINLIEEVTSEVLTKNRESLESDGMLTGNIELAVRLSALTSYKLLERLGMIEPTK